MEESRLILITDFIEQKLRKEKELEYYLDELKKLQMKIGYLEREVGLTNQIIDMIKTEQVYDIKEKMISNTNVKTISKD
tara:strand:- start:824 stop:1060 length:237 start_codon:yes stop_codon:yes gene_type:complete